MRPVGWEEEEEEEVRVRAHPTSRFDETPSNIVACSQLPEVTVDILSKIRSLIRPDQAPKVAVSTSNRLKDAQTKHVTHISHFEMDLFDELSKRLFVASHRLAKAFGHAEVRVAHLTVAIADNAGALGLDGAQADTARSEALASFTPETVAQSAAKLQAFNSRRKAPPLPQFMNEDFLLLLSRAGRSTEGRLATVRDIILTARTIEGAEAGMLASLIPDN
jgi:hypothetical protein